jgi:hypothetical protein
MGVYIESASGQVLVSRSGLPGSGASFEVCQRRRAAEDAQQPRFALIATANTSFIWIPCTRFVAQFVFSVQSSMLPLPPPASWRIPNAIVPFAALGLVASTGKSPA